MLVSYITTLLVFKLGNLNFFFLNLNVDAVWLTEGLISVPPFFPLMSFFSLLQPNEVAFSFFLLNLLRGLITFHFWKNIDQSSWKLSLKTVLGLSDVFSWLSRDYAFLAKIPQKCVICPSSHITSWGSWCWCFIMFILTLITWLMWFLLGFCTIKLTIFPFVTSKYLREKLWDYENPISPQISTTNFRIH